MCKRGVSDVFIHIYEQQSKDPGNYFQSSIVTFISVLCLTNKDLFLRDPRFLLSFKFPIFLKRFYRSANSWLNTRERFDQEDSDMNMYFDNEASVRFT